MSEKGVRTCIENHGFFCQDSARIEAIINGVADENFSALVAALLKARPSSLKGQYLRSVTLSSTMGPGVKVNPGKLA